MTIATADPAARLSYTAYGAEGNAFITACPKAKAAKREGSTLLGFAHTLANAIERNRRCQLIHRVRVDGGPVDEFTFASADVGPPPPRTSTDAGVPWWTQGG